MAEIFGWGLAYLLLSVPFSVAMGRFLSLSGGGEEDVVNDVEEAFPLDALSNIDR